MKFKIGDRIRISKNNHWAQGAIGTISEPPDFVKNLAADKSPWVNCHRIVQGKKDMLEFYWVNFDEPQVDADGDGPYMGGEIEVNLIENNSFMDDKENK